MPEPVDVVTRFIRAIEVGDLDAALALLTDEISYENVPIEPVVGREAVRAVLEGYLGLASQVEWRVLRTVATGPLVVNERLDRFHVGDGWLELPVAGFFEVTADSQISLWRDYFDMGTFTDRLAELTSST